MLNIGCHLSTSAGFYAMGKEALKIDANTFQFFTRNPRGGTAKKIDPEDARSLMEICIENNFAKLVAHSPYTLNPCSQEPKIRFFANEAFKDDLSRMEYLPGNYYNFHPGSHVGQGLDIGIELITKMLNDNIQEEQSTIVLLETMSGKGSEVGSTFSELKRIIDGVDLQDKMGVCIDTCHIYDAGYDIVNNLDGVLTEFDHIIGLDKLYAVHLNNSMNPFGSHKDRHQKIDEGTIPLDAIARIINHPALKTLPFILETPNDIEGYAKEIELLKSLYS